MRSLMAIGLLVCVPRLLFAPPVYVLSNLFRLHEAGSRQQAMLSLQAAHTELRSFAAIRGMDDAQRFVELAQVLLEMPLENLPLELAWRVTLELSETVRRMETDPDELTQMGDSFVWEMDLTANQQGRVTQLCRSGLVRLMAAMNPEQRARSLYLLSDESFTYLIMSPEEKQGILSASALGLNEWVLAMLPLVKAQASRRAAEFCRRDRGVSRQWLERTSSDQIFERMILFWRDSLRVLPWKGRARLNPEDAAPLLAALDRIKSHQSAHTYAREFEWLESRFQRKSLRHYVEYCWRAILGDE